MASYTNFDIAQFADTALEAFVSTLAPLNAFSTDASPNPASGGSSVLVPLIGSLTATTFSGYCVCGSTASVITVTLNKRRIVVTGQDDLTRIQNSYGNLLPRFARQQGAELAREVIATIWGALTPGAFGTAATTTSTGIAVADLLTGKKLLDAAKVPFIDRSYVLDTVPYNALLGTTQFIQAQIAGDPSAFRRGSMGQVFGADTYMTNALPGTNSVMGFIAHPSAIAVAMRYLGPGDAGRQYYIDARPVTDPATGATFGLRHLYDPCSGTEFIDLECLFGFSVGISNAARLYVRSD